MPLPPRLPTALVFWIYNLLFPFVFLLMLPAYLRRMVRRGNYRRHFGQRLGLYSAEDRARLAAGPPPVWVQAVSVGEMLVALKLVAALRERRPDAALVVSTTTTTGFQLARERLPPTIPVVYTPIDLRWSVRRAFAAIRPCELVIVDGGLWPNQLLEARRRGVRATLANARLSPRSERRFRRVGFVARNLFGLLDGVCVPEAADIARWTALGVGRERIVCTGSIKYDDSPAASEPLPAEHRAAAPLAAGQRTEPPPTPSGAGVVFVEDDPALRAVLRQLGVADDAPVLLAGSTHPGEERLLADVFVELRGRFPDLLLILAPRHVERAGEIVAALTPLGLRIATRTATLASAAVRDLVPESTANEPVPADLPVGGDLPSEPRPPDVFLLDTTGELHAWYALATVVFIGKSLAAVGGQNPAEAITTGKPVIFGPHMENFATLAAQLLAAGAAIQVRDAAGLAERAAALLADPEECRRLSGRAGGLLLGHRGAARRTAELLLPCRRLQKE